MSSFIKNVSNSFAEVQTQPVGFMPQTNRLENNATEYHVLVVWPNAQQNIKSVKLVIEKYFSKYDEIILDINENIFIKKICKIYDINAEKSKERMEISGFGPFTVIVIYDHEPEYKNLWRFGTGYTDTNVKISQCKNQLRELLGHPFLIHSSNDQIEARMNLRVLLGRNIKGKLTNSNEVFSSNDTVFSFLNDVDDYLVLRDYSSGDIDILTRKTPGQYARLLDAKHKRLRFLDFQNSGSASPIDVVNVHHGIFCPIWSENMLRNKVHDPITNRFRPNKEDLLFSLMYHYVLHKPSIPELGKQLMREKIVDLNFTKLFDLDFNNKKGCVYHLLKFLRKNNYSVPKPMDPKMFFDLEIANHLRQGLNLKDLSFDPQKKVSFSSDKEKFSALLKKINLIKLSNDLLNKNVPITYVRKYNTICTQEVFLDTAFINFRMEIDNGYRPYILKIFYSDYKIVLDEIEKSLSITVGINSEILNTPIKYERHRKFIFCLENSVTGENIENYVFKNREHISSKDIDKWLNEIQTSLDTAQLSHFDIHAKNILLSENQDIELIDFKTARSAQTGFVNPITCFKSSSDNDEKAIEILSIYLKKILAGGEIKGVYNPMIAKLIQDKFKHQFPDFNKIVQARRQYLENPSKVLTEKLKELDFIDPNTKFKENYSDEEKFLFSVTKEFSHELEQVRSLTLDTF